MKPRGIEWDKVTGIRDREVLTSALARRLRVSKEAVRAARRKLGVPVLAPTSVRPSTDWEAVPGFFDASVSTSEIARRADRSWSSAAEARRRRAFPAPALPAAQLRALRERLAKAIETLDQVMGQLPPGAR